MSSEPNSINWKILILISFAMNIFFIAFLIGRFSSSHGKPPHEANNRGLPGMALPPMPPGGMPMPNDGRQPPMPMGGMPPPPNNRMPSPPPFFGPGDLFNEKEIREDFAEAQKNFEKIQEIRKDFSEKLKNDNVTKEEIIKHFSEIDKLMNASRMQMQEKAANKIISMPPEERKRFAEKIFGAELPPPPPRR